MPGVLQRAHAKLRVRCLTFVACCLCRPWSYQHCKELAIKTRCLGGKLSGQTSTHTSQPFDNSAVAGGFVAFTAEWGLQIGERDQIMKALKNDASVPEELCLELELCRVSGDATRINTPTTQRCKRVRCGPRLYSRSRTRAGPGDDAAALPEPDTDLVIGIWRLPLKDLRIGGDLKAHTVTIHATAPIGLIRPSLPALGPSVVSLNTPRAALSP